MTEISKICSKCNRSFPATDEYFHRQKLGKYGFTSRCKTCKREINRQWAEDNADHVKEVTHQYYIEHRIQRAEYAKRWHESNRERIRERQRRYRIENYEARLAHERQYRAQNRDKEKERHQRYQKENNDKIRVHTHNRRARIRAASGRFTSADIERQLKGQKGKCYYASPECRGKLTIEHLVPLKRGGTNSADNIVLACEFHNFSKQDKLPHEFPQGGRLL